jgi:nucleoside-diphosphate-sugar epimerase
MQRVLVSGAGGFVGANLTRALLRNGHDVHVLLRHGRPRWRLADIIADLSVHEAAVEDRDGVRHAVREAKPDWAFHLAAYGAHSWQTGMERMISTNLSGCVHLLDACAETGVELFVHTGSSSEYGYKDHPARESEAVEPNSHYAITKAAATHYCQFTARTRRIQAVTTRLYSVFGPYEEPSRFIPTLLVHGLDHGLPPLVSPTVARDFVYVDDAVDALLLIADRRSRIPAGAVYNVCSGLQTTIQEVVQQLRTLIDIPEEPVWSTMPDRDWDTSVWVGDPGAIGRDLGWRPKVNLYSGLQRTLSWFQENPQLLELYRRCIFGAQQQGKTP